VLETRPRAIFSSTYRRLFSPDLFLLNSLHGLSVSATSDKIGFADLAAK